MKLEFIIITVFVIAAGAHSDPNYVSTNERLRTDKRDDDICKPGSKDIIPSPTNCAKYYDCGDNRTSYWGSRYPEECPTRQLYNTKTKRCEHYSMVDCGKRWEPVSYCDYSRNNCYGNSCIPCFVYHPSCKGLPDGLNNWGGRIGSPYFVVCKNNRTVYRGKCKQNNGYYMYDNNLKSCVKKMY